MTAPAVLSMQQTCAQSQSYYTAAAELHVYLRISGVIEGWQSLCNQVVQAVLLICLVILDSSVLKVLS